MDLRDTELTDHKDIASITEWGSSGSPVFIVTPDEALEIYESAGQKIHFIEGQPSPTFLVEAGPWKNRLVRTA